ncbi:hypothetical protein C8R44DRAFT_745468 [Mycena epipterygia]|nr:hypothetical protein C8R44DRAFT_745468 [Mycena epipterygia]
MSLAVPREQDPMLTYLERWGDSFANPLAFVRPRRREADDLAADMQALSVPTAKEADFDVAVPTPPEPLSTTIRGTIQASRVRVRRGGKYIRRAARIPSQRKRRVYL